MADEKKPYVFIRNDEEPGDWIYCGELPRVVRDENGKWDRTAHIAEKNDFFKFVGELILNEIEADMGGTDSDQFQLSVKVMELTKAEVDALPED